MWDKMKDWLLHGAIETDEKIAADLAGPDITSTGATFWCWNPKPTCRSAGSPRPTTATRWR
jgi:hypothetical protein